MEHTLIAAYVAMLIGYLIIDNEVSAKNCECRFVTRSNPKILGVLLKGELSLRVRCEIVLTLFSKFDIFVCRITRNLLGIICLRRISNLWSPCCKSSTVL